MVYFVPLKMNLPETLTGNQGLSFYCLLLKYSYHPLFMTLQLVTTGENYKVANWRLEFQVRCKWERVTILKVFCLFVCFVFVNDIFPWFGQLAVPGIFSFASLAPNPMSDTKLMFSMSLVRIILSEPYMSIRYQGKCDGLAYEKVDDKYQMRPHEWSQKAEQRWSSIWSTYLSVSIYVYI